MKPARNAQGPGRPAGSMNLARQQAAWTASKFWSQRQPRQTGSAATLWPKPRTTSNNEPQGFFTLDAKGQAVLHKPPRR